MAQKVLANQILANQVLANQVLAMMPMGRDPFEATERPGHEKFVGAGDACPLVFRSITPTTIGSAPWRSMD
jgi:hypothetical protein